MPINKLIDCFIFYNEFDLLNYRLNILNSVIDYFVIVESTHTFIGKEKPLFFNCNKHLFEEFNHKIIHIIVDDFPHKLPNIITKDNVWENEFFQRNAISRGLEQIGNLLNPSDIIIISDVDEIPDPNTLHSIKTNNNDSIEIYNLQMDVYYYNLNIKHNDKWDLCKILSYEKYKYCKIHNITCNDIRKTHAYSILNGGWHLSYFGDAKFIQNKIQNFSHQEFNKPEFTDLSIIEERIKNSLNLYNDPNFKIIQIKDNNYLPPEYDKYLVNYYTA